MQPLNDGQSWLEPKAPFPDAKDLVNFLLSDDFAPNIHSPFSKFKICYYG